MAKQKRTIRRVRKSVQECVHAKQFCIIDDDGYPRASLAMDNRDNLCLLVLKEDPPGRLRSHLNVKISANGVAVDAPGMTVEVGGQTIKLPKPKVTRRRVRTADGVAGKNGRKRQPVAA